MHIYALGAAGAMNPASSTSLRVIFLYSLGNFWSLIAMINLASVGCTDSNKDMNNASRLIGFKSFLRNT